MRKRAGTYVITNNDSRTFASITVSDLAQMIGASPVPGLSHQIRDKGLDLPDVSARR